MGKYIHTVRTFAVGWWLMVKRKDHQPLKCAHKRQNHSGVGGGAGSRYPGVGCKSKENKITIIEAGRMGLETTAKPIGLRFYSGVLMHEERLCGRGAAADGIDPHRMVHHHGVLWVGVEVC